MSFEEVLESLTKEANDPGANVEFGMKMGILVGFFVQRAADPSSQIGTKYDCAVEIPLGCLPEAHVSVPTQFYRVCSDWYEFPSMSLSSNSNTKKGTVRIGAVLKAHKSE